MTSSKGVFDVILKYLGWREWVMMALCGLCIVGHVYMDLEIPEYMSEITYGLQAGYDSDIIVSYGIDMVLCSIWSMVFALGMAVLAARVAANLSERLRALQFQQVGSWTEEDLDSFSVASLVTRSTNDVAKMQLFIARAIPLVVKVPVLAIWSIWKIAASSFEWTAVTAVATVILTVCIVVIVTRGIPFIRRMQGFVDAVNGETREELEGMRSIRAYNGETNREAGFNGASEELTDNAVSVWRIMSPMQPLCSAMLNLLTMAIYLVGAVLIHSAVGADEQMRLFSDMIMFTSYAAQVLSAMVLAAGILRDLPDYLVSSRRVQDVISHEPSILEGSETAASAPGEVVFEHVSFSYPGTGREVLSDVSFSIGPGQTLAVGGPTASGKSTLVKLIMRQYDADSGSVRVGGRDVRDYTADGLNAMIGYVPQTALVFSGSLLDNIRYGGSAGRSREEAERAAHIARLDDLVEKLPEGLESDVSQHGWNLSGGQKQRVSIARAVCKDPPIYVFDDAFSALDAATDRDVREALDREVSGATRIVVAQRIGTIMDADRILVLDDGGVVDCGRHAELMGRCPLYREIVESQREVFDGLRRPRTQRHRQVDGRPGSLFGP